jgi:hypothetical protein
MNIGGMNYMIPKGYFAGQEHKHEETEIPSMRGGEGRRWGRSAAATGANAAALPKRMRIEPASTRELP